MRTFQRGTYALALGQGLLEIGFGLLRNLDGGCRVRGQIFKAHVVIVGAGDFRIGSRNARARLSDHRLLQPPHGVQVGQRGALRLYRRFGFCQRRAIVTIIDFHQQVACRHLLIVSDRDFADKASNLGRR